MTELGLTSSNIKNAFYEATSEELTITFHSDRTYVYSQVNPRIVLDLLNAESAGRFLNKKIIPNYKCREI